MVFNVSSVEVCNKILIILPAKFWLFAIADTLDRFLLQDEAAPITYRYLLDVQVLL